MIFFQGVVLGKGKREDFRANFISFLLLGDIVYLRKHCFKMIVFSSPEPKAHW